MQEFERQGKPLPLEYLEIRRHEGLFLHEITFLHGIALRAQCGGTVSARRSTTGGTQRARLSGLLSVRFPYQIFGPMIIRRRSILCPGLISNIEESTGG